MSVLKNIMISTIQSLGYEKVRMTKLEEVRLVLQRHFLYEQTKLRVIYGSPNEIKLSGINLGRYCLFGPVPVWTEVGPSMENGLLLVPTYKILVQLKNTPRGGGSIVAFGIP